MNPEVVNAVAALAGRDVEVGSWRAVGGGSINAAWWVTLSDGTSRFVKTNAGAAPDMFEREAEGLAALAETGALRVPSGALAGEAAGERFLTMEAIETGRPRSSFDAGFGRRLAEMHRSSASSRYGFDHDNYIGSTPQPNSWTEDWVEFFGRHRLGHQLDLARRRGLVDGELSRLADRLLGRLSDLLTQPEEPPCLLHGDLWSGNYMVDSAGEPVLIDPACYYGQREADLAMTELFGGFGPDFYDAYREAWPIPAGSFERTKIYKLYHLLNHLNLFGGSYRGQCVEILKSLV